jgi:uncharacterized membrane protein YvlD (DUF360 family)
MSRPLHRPLSLGLLVSALGLLALGGLAGGVAMLRDPTGAALGMTEVRPLLLIADYTLPGLFLVLVMGAFPLALAAGLLWTSAQPTAGGAPRGRFSWFFWGAVAESAILALWLAVQGMLIGLHWPMQFATAGLGVLLAALPWAPGIQQLLRPTPLRPHAHHAPSPRALQGRPYVLPRLRTG